MGEISLSGTANCLKHLTPQSQRQSAALHRAATQNTTFCDKSKHFSLLMFYDNYKSAQCYGPRL